MKKYLLFLAIVSFTLFSCKGTKEQDEPTPRQGIKMTGHIVTDSNAKPLIIPVTAENDPREIPASKPETYNYSLDPDSGRVSISTIDAEDGLPEARSSGMLKDREGNLWLAYGRGIIKYDGNETVSYPFGKVGVNILAIQEDPIGNLWFCGTDLFKFDGKTVELVKAVDSIKKKRTFMGYMQQDRWGNLWFPIIGNFGDGLAKHDGKKLTLYTEKDGLAKSYIRNLALDSVGNVYILMNEVGVQKFDGNRFTTFIKKEDLPGNNFSAIQIDNQGNTWLGALDGSGLIKYDGSKFTRYTTKDGLAENNFLKIYKDISGGLWFTHRNSYSYYNGSGFKAYSKADGLSFSISIFSPLSPGTNGNTWIGGESSAKRLDRGFITYEDFFIGTGFNRYSPISSVMVDRKENLWLSNFTGNLVRYDGKTVAVYADTASLGNDLQSIMEDKNENIWTASSKGIIKFDGHSYKVYSKEYGITDERVMQKIFEDRSGNIWFGNAITISKFDGHSFTHYSTGQSFQERRELTSIFQDRNGNIWFGKRDYGLSKFDGKIFTNFTIKDGLADSTVLDIAEDDFGNIWFATGSGLNRFDGKTIYRYTTDDGLSHNQIRQIVKDTINHLFWLGTGAGITRLTIMANHPDSIAFLNFDRRNGFPVPPGGKNFIDKKGMIWLTGSSQKLIRFDYAHLKTQMRPFKLHIKNISLNNEKLCWSNLLPGGKKDSLLLKTEMEIRFGKRISDVVLQKMTDEFSGIRFDSIVPFEYIPNKLVLPYSVNTIGFDFAAIDPYFSKFTRYQYMLEGSGKKWSPLSKNSTANFANLREGSYTFKLKALNPYGIWSEMSYSFKVLPPWYRTWWAYTIYALLFLAALRIFSKWRERRLRHEKEQLQHKVEERTVALKKKSEELEHSLEDLKATQSQLIQSEKMASLGELTAGIAHEIQNPLNFVNNFSEVSVELIKEMVDEVDKGNTGEVKAIAGDLVQNLEKINHHGKRADAIVKGMLQHSQSSSGKKEPTDINALADEYLRLAYHGLRAKNKDFNATMKTNFDETIGNINIIPQDIGRVILNLITNAFYVVNEKSKQGIVGYEPTVSITTGSIQPPSGGRSVQIKVADNGGGIPQKILDKIFQPFFTTKPTGQGTGLGLSLSYDIVKAHGGELKVDTKEGEGSEFIIQLNI